jgi:hypothetical protein
MPDISLLAASLIKKSPGRPTRLERPREEDGELKLYLYVTI